VRLVDVVGNGSTLDAQAHPVYDPWSTPFPSSGFDADAVGAPEPDAIAALASGALARVRSRAAPAIVRALALTAALALGSGLAASAEEPAPEEIVVARREDGRRRPDPHREHGRLFADDYTAEQKDLADLLSETEGVFVRRFGGAGDPRRSDDPRLDAVAGGGRDRRRAREQRAHGRARPHARVSAAARTRRGHARRGQRPARQRARSAAPVNLVTRIGRAGTRGARRVPRWRVRHL
jgi:hypothetical protein